jgi:hypothetical protein
MIYLNKYTYTLIFIILVSGISYKLLNHSDSNNDSQTLKENKTKVSSPSLSVKKPQLPQKSPIITQDKTIAKTPTKSRQNIKAEVAPTDIQSQENNERMTVNTHIEADQELNTPLVEPENIEHYESTKQNPSTLNADQEYIEHLIIDSYKTNKTRISNEAIKEENIPLLSRDELEELYGVDPNSINNTSTVINQDEIDSIINTDSDYLNSLISKKTTNSQNQKMLTEESQKILNEAYKEEPLE